MQCSKHSEESMDNSILTKVIGKYQNEKLIYFECFLKAELKGLLDMLVSPRNYGHSAYYKDRATMHLKILK